MVRFADRPCLTSIDRQVDLSILDRLESPHAKRVHMGSPRVLGKKQSLRRSTRRDVGEPVRRREADRHRGPRFHLVDSSNYGFGRKCRDGNQPQRPRYDSLLVRRKLLAAPALDGFAYCG